VLAVSLATFAGACGGGDAPPAPSSPAVSTVEIAPVPATITIGQTHQLVATPRAADGAPLTNRAVTWASEDGAVVTVTPAGLLTATSVGTAWVRATSEGRSARTEVRVVAPAPAPAPLVTALDPASVLAGPTEPVTLRVLGEHFVPGMTVRLDGAERAATVVSATELRVAVSAADLARPATIAVTVHAPAGGSAAALLRVEAAPAPAPAIAALEPATVMAGGTEPFTLVVRGEGFTPRSQVRWNGAARATQYVSAAELRVSVAPADVAAAGTRTIAVVTDAPGGGQSEARLLVLARAARLAVTSPWGSDWTWPGLSLPLEARVRDALDRPLDDRVVAWSVGDAAIAGLANGGAQRTLAYGGIPGRTWVEASVEGLRERHPLVVHAAPLFDLVFGMGTGDARHLALWSPHPNGGSLTRLRLPVLAFGPAPSPDGRRIAFVGAPAGGGFDTNHDVYVVDRDGTNLQRLTTDAGFDGSPTWSPDGSRLAFVSTRAGHGDIWTMNADGSDPHRLTDARGAVPLPGSGFGAGMPAWSPDGTTIVYVVTSTDGSKLWTMRPDGSGKRPLGTPAIANDLLPDWSPDGALLVVRRVTHTSGGTARSS
jgi:hypothetical protein